MSVLPIKLEIRILSSEIVTGFVSLNCRITRLIYDIFKGDTESGWYTNGLVLIRHGYKLQR